MVTAGQAGTTAERGFNAATLSDRSSRRLVAKGLGPDAIASVQAEQPLASVRGCCTTSYLSHADRPDEVGDVH